MNQLPTPRTPSPAGDVHAQLRAHGYRPGQIRRYVTIVEIEDADWHETHTVVLSSSTTDATNLIHTAASVELGAPIPLCDHNGLPGAPEAVSA